MTFTIPPDSPKAATAAAFGRELVKACQARGIPRSELWRSTGIGRTAMDNYRTGSSLPRTETAATLAAVLDWPKLLEIVRAARTRHCRRCARPFTNEGGNQAAKKYCDPECRRLAINEAQASRRIRQAGQTGDNRRRYQALARLRSGIRIAEERTAERQAAIDAMCASCEPGGSCRDGGCHLRAFSPLPLAVHDVGTPRTLLEVRAELNRKAAPARRAAMLRRHAEDPSLAEATSERTRQWHASLTPEERDAWRAKVGMAQKSPAERSAMAKKSQATRRARRAAEQVAP